MRSRRVGRIVFISAGAIEGRVARRSLMTSKTEAPVSWPTVGVATDTPSVDVAVDASSCAEEGMSPSRRLTRPKPGLEPNSERSSHGVFRTLPAEATLLRDESGGVAAAALNLVPRTASGWGFAEGLGS